MSRSTHILCRQQRCVVWAMVVLVLVGTGITTNQICEGATGYSNDGQSNQRGARVKDIIEMTSVATGEDSGEEDPIASFSPDQSKIIVVLQRANLHNNTNEYSLLLWNKRGLLAAERPKRILTLASTSARPAIRHITWLNDDKTIVFLGEHPGELQQLYSLNVDQGTLKKLTSHSTSVCGYSVTPDGTKFVFTAEPVAHSIF